MQSIHIKAPQDHSSGCAGRQPTSKDHGDVQPALRGLTLVTFVASRTLLNAPQTHRKSCPGVFSRSLPEIKTQIVTFSSLKSPDTWLIRIRKLHEAKSFKY